jgi:hypothetical protein
MDGQEGVVGRQEGRWIGLMQPDRPAGDASGQEGGLAGIEVRFGSDVRSLPADGSISAGLQVRNSPRLDPGVLKDLLDAVGLREGRYVVGSIRGMAVSQQDTGPDPALSDQDECSARLIHSLEGGLQSVL